MITLTLNLEEQLVRQAESIAARHSLSLTDLFSQELVRLINRAKQPEAEYEQAKQRALAYLETGFHLGGQPVPRESLYDR